METSHERLEEGARPRQRVCPLSPFPDSMAFHFWLRHWLASGARSWSHPSPVVAHPSSVAGSTGTQAVQWKFERLATGNITRWKSFGRITLAPPTWSGATLDETRPGGGKAEVDDEGSRWAAGENLSGLRADNVIGLRKAWQGLLLYFSHPFFPLFNQIHLNLTNADRAG